MVELKGQPHLMTQDASTVDPSKLTALTPEVVSLYFYTCIVLCLCIFISWWVELIDDGMIVVWLYLHIMLFCIEYVSVAIRTGESYLGGPRGEHTSCAHNYKF